MKPPDFSLEQLQSALVIVCDLDNRFGRKMAFGKGLSPRELKEKRALEKCYHLIYNEIKQLQQLGVS